MGVITSPTPVTSPATASALGTVIVPVSGNLSVDGSGNISTGANVPLLGSANTFTSGPQIVNPAVLATANYGSLSIGGAPWDGVSVGHFAGSASGTRLAINAASGATGNLADWQVAGVSKYSVDVSGNLVLAGTLAATSLSGTLADARLSANVPLGLWKPADHGYLAWSYDPALNSGQSTAPVGTLILIKVKVPSALSVATLTCGTNIAGAALSNCFIGLYDATGALLGASADQSTAWAATAGVKTAALAGGAVSVASGVCYVAFLVGAATTAPAFFSRNTALGTLTNVNLAVQSARAATNGSGLSALPASVTMTSNTISSLLYWVGLS